MPTILLRKKFSGVLYPMTSRVQCIESWRQVGIFSGVCPLCFFLLTPLRLFAPPSQIHFYHVSARKIKCVTLPVVKCETANIEILKFGCSGRASWNTVVPSYGGYYYGMLLGGGHTISSGLAQSLQTLETSQVKPTHPPSDGPRTHVHLWPHSYLIY